MRFSSRTWLTLYHIGVASACIVVLFALHEDPRVMIAHVVPWTIPILIEALLAITIPTKGYALAVVSAMMIVALGKSSGDIADDGLYLFYWFAKAGGLWVAARLCLLVFWKVTTGSFDRDGIA